VRRLGCSQGGRARGSDVANAFALQLKLVAVFYGKNQEAKANLIFLLILVACNIY
jgi:hypothetical protein